MPSSSMANAMANAIAKRWQTDGIGRVIGRVIGKYFSYVPAVAQVQRSCRGRKTGALASEDPYPTAAVLKNRLKSETQVQTARAERSADTAREARRGK